MIKLLRNIFIEHVLGVKYQGLIINDVTIFGGYPDSPPFLCHLVIFWVTPTSPCTCKLRYLTRIRR